jgi:hypothetical protein
VSARPSEDRFEVKASGVVVPVALRADGRWWIDVVVDLQDGNGPGRKRWNYGDRSKARRKARDVCELVASGRVDLVDLSGDELREVRRVLAFRRANPGRSAATVEAVVGLMMTAKRSMAGREDRYLGELERTLKRVLQPVLGVAFSELRSEDLEALLDGYRDAAAKYRKNLRSAMVTLWRWAMGRGYCAPAKNGKSAAELLGTVRVARGTIGVFDVDGFWSVLHGLRPVMWPWFLVGCFFGVRREEMAPGKGSAKLPLTWAALRFEAGDAGILDLPAACAKAQNGRQRRRVVPMQAGVRAWLEPLRGKMDAAAPIVGGDIEHALEGLADGLWVKNGPRHTYGTARVAVTQNVALVANEMGNSVREVKADYDAVRMPAEGRAWFSVVPGVAEMARLRGLARKAG